MSQKCVDENQITKDIKRTKTALISDPIIQNKYYQAINSVLTAYSNYCPNIGYVQGMNMTVSAILFNICNDYNNIQKFEEDAFQLFVILMEITQIGMYYEDRMSRIPGLIEDIKERVQQEATEVYWHIISTDVV